MKKSTTLITLAALLASAGLKLNAQVKNYTVADAHSHNDYKNNIPFYRAYEKGFGSIEADCYAVN
jgi:alkaline phosphatase